MNDSPQPGADGPPPENPAGVGGVRPIDRPPEPPVAGFGPLQFVARGGSATVYRTHRLSDDTEVAIKILDHDHGGLERELNALDRLTGAPHVMQVLDHGILDDGRPWIASAFASLGSTQRLLESGPVPPEVVARIASQAADALTAAHDAGVIHCDLKPSNLLIDTDGTVQVSDFGISRIDTTATGPATMSMTLLYSAPEVLEGQPPDQRTDIYSLGLTLVALLNGRPPFTDEADRGIAALVDRICSGPPPTTPEHTPDWLAAILQRCTATAPEDRLDNVTQLTAALRDQTAPQPTHHRRRRRRWTAAIAALLSVAVIGAVLILQPATEDGEAATEDGEAATSAVASTERLPSSIVRTDGIGCEPARGTGTLDPGAGYSLPVDQKVAIDVTLLNCVPGDGSAVMGGQLTASGVLPEFFLDSLSCAPSYEDPFPSLDGHLDGKINWGDGTTSTVAIGIECSESGAANEARAGFTLTGGRFAGDSESWSSLRLDFTGERSYDRTLTKTFSLMTEFLPLGGNPPCTILSGCVTTTTDSGDVAMDPEVSSAVVIAMPDGGTCTRVNDESPTCTGPDGQPVEQP